MNNVCLLLCFFIDGLSLVACKRSHYVYWNSTNTMFNSDTAQNILDVNQNNLPWEYDQLNIICPLGTSEKHIIYSVSKEEFDSCRVSNPKPKIVAVCDRPERFKYFTITFRSFSPTPGGLEFKPGQSYYFVSTSTRKDLHRRVGGYCSTHNMKMIFKVGLMKAAEPDAMLSPLGKSLYSSTGEEKASQETRFQYPSVAYSSTQGPQAVYHYRPSTATVRTSDYIYYYSPRDLIHLKMAAKKYLNRNRSENSSLQAEKLTSGSGGLSTWLPCSVLVTLVYILNCLL